MRDPVIKTGFWLGATPFGVGVVPYVLATIFLPRKPDWALLVLQFIPVWVLLCVSVGALSGLLTLVVAIRLKQSRILVSIPLCLNLLTLLWLTGS
jgi:hypothetical protein